jgi:hypothetical protein
VASSVQVPALAGAHGGEGGPGPGGEWALLLDKLVAWGSGGQPAALWSRARHSSLLIAGLAGLLLLLRLYAGLIAALDSLPLLPGLLELVAVIWLVRYGGPRLVRRDGRQQLIRAVAGRWHNFRGG